MKKVKDITIADSNLRSASNLLFKRKPKDDKQIEKENNKSIPKSGKTDRKS
jgi:hypothetical protein